MHTAERRAFIVAMMLLLAAMMISVPSFASPGSVAAEAVSTDPEVDEAETVLIIVDVDETSTVEEVAVEYSKAQAERAALESQDKRVLVADPGAPRDGMGGKAADMFRQAMGPEGFIGPMQPGIGPAPGPVPEEPAPQHTDAEPPQQSEERSVAVISSSDIDAQPDASLIAEVAEAASISGDADALSISETLQAYLSWLSVWGGEGTTIEAVHSERKDDAESDDADDRSFGDPIVVEETDSCDESAQPEDPEPCIQPAGPRPEPQTHQFYYTGVTTSGSSF